MSLRNFFSNFLLRNKYTFSFFVNVFQQVAKTGQGSNTCLEAGYLPVSLGYYSPIPDLKDLEKRDVWSKKFDMSAIDFDREAQLKLLAKLGRKYGKECRWPLEPTDDELDFFINNGSFSYGCAASLYCMIREFKPRRIVEIGSGNSSKVISQAIEVNKINTKYSIIDPFPKAYIKKLNVDRLYKKQVELMPLRFFDSLQENDILFIDSGHTVRIGGDVNFLFLHVFPRIKPGVFIHFHDIPLPFEYGKGYAIQEHFRQFWTEQYILHSFLSFNREYKVMLAMYYLMTRHRREFKKAFSNYNPKVHFANSGSFWIRRNIH